MRYLTPKSLKFSKFFSYDSFYISLNVQMCYLLKYCQYKRYLKTDFYDFKKPSKSINM